MKQEEIDKALKNIEDGKKRLKKISKRLEKTLIKIKLLFELSRWKY